MEARANPMIFNAVEAERGRIATALGYDGSGRLLGWFALSMALGAAWFFVRLTDPGSALIAGCAGAAAFSAAALFWTWRSGRLFPQQAVILAVLLGVSVGFLSGVLRTARVDTVTLDRELDRAMVEGWISGVDHREGGARLRIHVHAISDLSRTETPTLVRMTQRGRPQLSPGRFVRCYGALRPPPPLSLPGDFDFAREAWFDGLGGVGFVYGRCEPGSLASPDDMASRLELAAFRRQLAERVEEAIGEGTGGFAAALVSGDRSLMAEADQEALRDSGLAHLLAISGLHLGLVGGVVYLLVWRGLALVPWIALRIPVQKPAAAIALFAISSYFLISGMSVATQRAWIMALVFFGAILLDRRAFTARALAIAMILICALQPEAVISPGFQMSFAATGLLIAAYASWTRRNRARPNQQSTSKVRTLLLSILVTSVVGGFATAPYALYHFDRLAPFGLIANVLAMPLVSFLVVPAAVVTMVLIPFGAADLGLQFFGWSLDLILAVAHWVSGMNDGAPLGAFALFGQLPTASLVLLSLAIGIVSLHEGRGVVTGASLGLVALALWIAQGRDVAHIVPGGWVYVRTDTGFEGRWTGAVKAETLPPLKFSDAPEGAPCSERTCRFTLEGGADLSLADVGEVCINASTDRGPICAGPLTERKAAIIAYRTLYGTYRLDVRAFPDRIWTRASRP